MNHLRKLFVSDKQYRIFLLLCLTTFFDFLLVGYRIYYTGFDYEQLASVQAIANTRSITYMFLIWNLFLAWIPYWISMSLEKINQKKENFIKIEIPESFESFKIMEQFIEQLKDQNFKLELQDVLQQKKPFQHFKHKIDQSNFRQSWFAFKQNELEKIVENQLK